MITKRQALAPIAAALSLCLLAACGGKHRPPVVATSPGVPTASDRGQGREPVEPLDMGPDIRPMDSGGLGEDILNTGASGEGGPLADILFDFDQATLSPDAQATLERHALWLQTHRDLRVTIEGHCDERGTVEYNLALGDQRAQVAREYLIGLGVSPERLTAVSFGKERPLDPGHNEGAWARNRRDHFVVSR
jgi:peptidoglycan-associated lipoprotein